MTKKSSSVKKSLPKVVKVNSAPVLEAIGKITKSTPAYVKVPTAAVVFFTTVLLVISFVAGTMWFKLRSGDNTVLKTSAAASSVFAAEKSDKPEFKFFVMSFCPFGNQAEDVIKPVAELFKDKVDIRPQYIFDKITGTLTDYCKPRSGDPSKCSDYIKAGYFNTEEECRQTIEDQNKACLDEKNYVKIGNNYYSSLHGRVEANQDIREMCAYNLADDKMKWWKFVEGVNKNCDDKNADTCWEQYAKDAGFDSTKITDCFNKDAATLIEKEIELTTKYQVSGSPTMIVNGVQFPPESAYQQDGKGAIKVGNNVITQDKFRTPNTIKEAICASFNKAPKECKQELTDPTANTAAANAAAAGGGCN